MRPSVGEVRTQYALAKLVKLLKSARKTGKRAVAQDWMALSRWCRESCANGVKWPVRSHEVRVLLMTSQQSENKPPRRT